MSTQENNQKLQIDALDSDDDTENSSQHNDQNNNNNTLTNNPYYNNIKFMDIITKYEYQDSLLDSLKMKQSDIQIESIMLKQEYELTEKKKMLILNKFIKKKQRYQEFENDEKKEDISPDNEQNKKNKGVYYQLKTLSDGLIPNQILIELANAIEVIDDLKGMPLNFYIDVLQYHRELSTILHNYFINNIK